jgi:hypothetical protein
MEKSMIEPHHFFSKHTDKTKFNWFAFELACEIDSAVPPQLKKLLAKRGYSKQKFNMSCIRLAKLLQNVVLRKLNHEIPEMQINHTEVELAFPNLNDKLINSLLDCTAKAWGSLLDVCVSCPSACVSNKDDYCPMFDDEFYYEQKNGAELHS